MTRITVLLVAILAAGCQATATPDLRSVPGPGSAAPSGPPVLGLDWERAASLDRPENFLESVPPDYISNHPILRIAGQATMSDVVVGPQGLMVAVGYAPPDWLPVAWTSSDGQSWAIHAMGSAVNTFPTALTIGPDGTIVAVGRSAKRPVAWTSADGSTWRERTVPVLGQDGTAERMTSVITTANGYLAGGSMGPELSDRHARFWRSADGATWVPVADDAQAFADAEVRAIAAYDGGLVAVGVAGGVQHPTGAVAWTSTDAETWTRIDDPSFKGAVAVSVVAAPFGGLIVVGSSLDRQEAVVWRSPDGQHWTRASSGRDFEEPGFVWMTDVVAVDDVVIAIGDYQPNQRGTAVSWISRDGQTWQRDDPAPVQEQAEFAAIARGGPGAVAVGVFGLPDSFVPTVWLTPAR